MSRILAHNALANILQAVVGAVLLFALYRYINTKLGVEQLGVWAVVLAAVSASRLADLGLGAGVTRFVARDRARADSARACEVVDTALLTVILTVGAVLPLLYHLVGMLLPHLFDHVDLLRAQAILPYALFSLWLSIASAIFQGGIDGCERMDLRAGLVVAGQLLLLVLAFGLVPQGGLVGLAWAQVGQGLFLAVGGRMLLRHTLPGLPWLPRRWRIHVLRELLGYGVKLQASSLLMLLFDPIAKALMARFGGPAAAGYFEMANQVVLKARNVVVAANRAVVPHVAVLAETESTRLLPLYYNNMRMLVYVTLPAVALLIAWGGGVSWLLVGAYDGELVFLLGLLSLAWGCNVFASPAYFINMGVGHVGWNTIGSGIMGAVNASLGWWLGSEYGAYGVAVGYAIGLVAGSAFLLAAFHRLHNPCWSGAFNREHIWLAVGSAVVLASGWAAPLQPSSNELATLLVRLVVPFLALGTLAWFHPMRSELLGRKGMWVGRS